MIERHHPALPILRQCALIGISRSAFYGGSPVERPENLALMQARAIPAKAGTYIPMRKGFLYLVAIMDWFMPKVAQSDSLVFCTRFSNSLGKFWKIGFPSKLPCVSIRELWYQSAGSRLAALQHHGGGLLHRSPQRGDGSVRQAIDLQHGSGQPVHQSALHRGTGGGEGENLDVRARPLDGEPRSAQFLRNSSNGCGARSNTNASTSTPSRPDQKPAPGSGSGWIMTTAQGHTRLWAGKRRWRLTWPATASTWRRNGVKNQAEQGRQSVHQTGTTSATRNY